MVVSPIGTQERRNDAAKTHIGEKKVVLVDELGRASNEVGRGSNELGRAVKAVFILKVDLGPTDRWTYKTHPSTTP